LFTTSGQRSATSKRWPSNLAGFIAEASGGDNEVALAGVMISRFAPRSCGLSKVMAEKKVRQAAIGFVEALL
jgi:hypothetical protein